MAPGDHQIAKFAHRPGQQRRFRLDVHRFLGNLADGGKKTLGLLALPDHFQIVLAGVAADQPGPGRVDIGDAGHVDAGERAMQGGEFHVQIAQGMHAQGPLERHGLDTVLVVFRQSEFSPFPHVRSYWGKMPAPARGSPPATDC